MVERKVCSTGEESNESRSFSRSVEPVVGRDNNCEGSESRVKLEKLGEPEIVRSLNNLRVESRRDNSISGLPLTVTGRFSLFKWFKRGSRDPTSSWDRRDDEKCSRLKKSHGESSDWEENAVTSELSSTESVETIYSTATVRSFAFQSGTPGGRNNRENNDEASSRHFEEPFLKNSSRSVGPFGVGAAKIVTNLDRACIDVTKTLPANALSKRLDITARYSLQSCNGSSATFGSCGNFDHQRQRFVERPGRREDRSSGRGVHVRGKRRAPDPPVLVTKAKKSEDEAVKIGNVKRRVKRRQAPRPPDINLAKFRETDASAKKSVPLDERTDTAVSSKNIQVSSVCLETGSTHLPGEKQNHTPEIEESSSTGGNDVDKISVETVRKNSATLKDPPEADIESVDPREEEKIVETKSEEADPGGSISNDSLVLQGGVLHSKRESTKSLPSGVTLVNLEPETCFSRSRGRINVTTGSQTSSSAMPRPWYKRSVFEHSRDTGTSKRGDILRNSPQAEVREDDTPDKTISAASATKYRSMEKNQDGGTLSRLNFFHRGEKSSEERNKKENKRKSGISILTNISELDKEAAAIVQEEQARVRAASVFLQASRSRDDTKRNEETEDVVQEILTSAIENSPKRGTRALISKFNAISNITKVTVNTSFFAKYPRDSRLEKNDIAKNSIDDGDSRERITFLKNETVRTDKDLSRYFLPTQKTTAPKRIDDDNGLSSRETIGKNSNDSVSARLSFFQSISSEKKAQPEVAENSNETRVKNLNLQSGDKISRLRVNVSGESPPRSDPPSGVLKNNESKNPDYNVKTERSNENTGKKNSEIAEKEFTKIFQDTEKQLSKNKLESLCSSQVSKVLDILVEAEKNDRRRSNFSNNQNENFVASSPLSSSSSKGMENAMKTDLKEMLKEMKHSLPKRPKSRKINNEEIPANHEEKVLLPEVKREVALISDKKKEFFTEENKKASLFNPVTIIYPPPIRIGPTGDYDRQKVSSAVQTSGNLKKISNRPENDDKLSKWRKDEIPHRTSVRTVATAATSGLEKKTFQLIRPREFAQIEAIKTMKNTETENTYANVIKQSIYANALVPATKINFPNISKNEERVHLSEDKKLDSGREIAETETTESRTTESQNLNTLAVNRLLRKLEAAIASGHHQQAAGLAKELARLKIHCSVVRQRTKVKDIVNVNMYIEDKLAHQGPIPLRLARSMTVAQLKAKVFTEFEIPINVQRWIVGKNLADDDSTKLEELNAVEGSPLFLYLVAPEAKIQETQLRDEKLSIAEKEEHKDPELEVIEEIPKVAEEFDEAIETPTDSKVMKEEEMDDECISEEVRMERYEALILLENCDVIPNSEAIECPICFVTYGPQEGVILRDCLHMFCRPCIANTIRYCEEAEIKCPFRDTEYTCESTLQEREIKALVEPEVYQQHLAKSIAQAENNAGNNAFHCKTPDCPGWCIYDDNVNNFLCPVCGVNNCLTCQVVHAGKNCRQYQEELRLSKETDQESKRTAAMLEEMVDRGEALPCPTCAVVLMKKWGCDWLRCSMCKTEICWVTRGPRWGPGGKGDTSGGCRCGEKGVKCHPRCNYCH